MSDIRTWNNNANGNAVPAYTTTAYPSYPVTTPAAQPTYSNYYSGQVLDWQHSIWTWIWVLLMLAILVLAAVFVYWLFKKEWQFISREFGSKSHLHAGEGGFERHLKEEEYTGERPGGSSLYSRRPIYYA